MNSLKKELKISNNDSEWLYKIFPIQKQEHKPLSL